MRISTEYRVGKAPDRATTSPSPPWRVRQASPYARAAALERARQAFARTPQSLLERQSGFCTSGRAGRASREFWQGSTIVRLFCEYMPLSPEPEQDDGHVRCDGFELRLT